MHLLYTCLMGNRNIIEQLQQEAQAYSGIKELETISRDVGSFSSLPIQPVYTAFKQLNPQEASKLLSKSSQEQREAFRQLDLWDRDIVSVKEFEYWLETVICTKDLPLIAEFSLSEEFAVYLKSICHISTFDVEDPQYPEHNYYFLTDDTLLLIEYGEDYDYGDQLKLLLKTIYGELGVDKAYAYLFKILVDQHSNFEEESYRRKNDNLRNFGFVDYYEAIEKLTPFPSYKRIDSFIQKKLEKVFSITDLDVINQNNIIPGNFLTLHDISNDSLNKELLKVDGHASSSFFRFNFVRLFNAVVVTSNSGLGNMKVIRELNKEIYNFLNLGIEYIQSLSDKPKVALLKYFDFFQLFQIGQSLVFLEKKSLKSSFSKNDLNLADEKFLGELINKNLECWYERVPSIRIQGEVKEIKDLSTYLDFKSQVLFTNEFLPFVSLFKETYQKLLDDNLINDSYYLNYNCEDINLETILISSIVNFHFSQDPDQKKLGVSLENLKGFISVYSFNYKDFNRASFEKLQSLVSEYTKTYGLNEVTKIESFLCELLIESFTGYEFEQMEDAEYEFFGGPLILNS
ncbi:DUF6178 family protein [Bacteriovoracaceae bacterium]|nr:DUF6178 family protein [Bacteriovoracaceae bacterium]